MSITRVSEDDVGAEPKAFAAGHSPQAASACRRCVRRPKVTVHPLEGHSPQVAKERRRCFRQPQVKVQRGGLACYVARCSVPMTNTPIQIAERVPSRPIQSEL